MIALPDLNCFFDPLCKDLKSQYILPESETHHAMHVLRLRAGNSILVSNGNGCIFKAEIIDVKRSEITYSATDKLAEFGTNPHSNSIACGILSARERMELMVEKIVEIGINEIIFFSTKRSQRKKLNIDRLEKVAISALKQSRKAFLPKVSIIEFNELLQLNYTQKLVAICDGNDYEHLINKAKGKNTLTVIGPEGDFLETEILQLLNNDFEACALGNERLRSETAAIYALTCTNLKSILTS